MSVKEWGMPKYCPDCGKDPWQNGGIRIVEKKDSDGIPSGQIRYTRCQKCGCEKKLDESFYD